MESSNNGDQSTYSASKVPTWKEGNKTCFPVIFHAVIMFPSHVKTSFLSHTFLCCMGNEAYALVPVPYVLL